MFITFNINDDQSSAQKKQNDHLHVFPLFQY